MINLKHLENIWMMWELKIERKLRKLLKDNFGRNMRIYKWKWRKMKKIDWKGWRMLLSGFRKDRKKKGKECTKNHLNIQNIKVMMTILLTDVSKLRKKKRKKRDKVRNKLLKNNKWPSWINSWNKHCQQQKSNTNLSLMTLIYFPSLHF